MLFQISENLNLTGADLTQLQKGLEFINKMRKAGAYKCDQETTVGTTEGGLNQLKSTYGLLSINWLQFVTD